MKLAYDMARELQAIMTDSLVLPDKYQPARRFARGARNLKASDHIWRHALAMQTICLEVDRN